MLLFTVDSKIIKKDCRKIRFEEEIRLEEMVGKMFSLEDWGKTTIDEIRERWEKRRREIEEIEKKKTEKEKRIEEARKKKDEKRKRAIRERRCFVCGIFGHMARYCRNKRGEEKRGSSMPQNKFEVLKDRVMQRGEGSGREMGKDRREIMKEEREKKERKMKVQKKDLEKKGKMREVEKREEEKIEIEEGQRRPERKIEEKIEEEKEIEMRGFSGGEILKGRYPLVWWKVRCYECGGLGHRKSDHREKKEEKNKKIEKDEI